MKFRRIIIAISVAAIGAASLLVPAGADAKISRRRTRPAAETWRLNGSESRMPVYVNCKVSATRGTPVSRNLLTTRAKGNVRMTMTFLDDRAHPMVLWGSHRMQLSSVLSLPCSGTGQLRYRVERITKVRTRSRRALGTPFVTAMIRPPVLHAALRNRAQLIEQSIVPVVFVQSASS